MTSFEFAKQSIRGQRKNQEDTCDFYTGSHNVSSKEAEGGKILAVLADGMGGHVGGAFASRLACSHFITHYSSFPEGDVADHLSLSLKTSNEVIAAKVSEDSSLSGMGCTLIGAVFDQSQLYWVSVGDSLLYLYRDNKLSQLNQDHSYLSELLKYASLGEITEEEARQHPSRNALLSAVMGKKIERIDLRSLPFTLGKNDWVLLASDGILTLSHSEIEVIIAKNEKSGAQALVDALLNAVELANRPNQDNTTVMAIRPELEHTAVVQTSKPKQATKSKTGFFSGFFRSLSVAPFILVCACLYIAFASTDNSSTSDLIEQRISEKSVALAIAPGGQSYDGSPG